jgi:hypothetical protein
MVRRLRSEATRQTVRIICSANKRYLRFGQAERRATSGRLMQGVVYGHGRSPAPPHWGDLKISRSIVDGVGAQV